MTLDKLQSTVVRPDFRKTIAFGVITLAALIAGHQLGGINAHDLQPRLASWGCVLVVLVFGVLASRSAAREVDRIIAARAGVAASNPIRVVVLLVGYLITLFAALQLMSLPLGQFLVGGTVGALIVGIAAQQVLGNLFAGLVMLFARPYVPGQYIRIRSGGLGGPHEGTVTSVGLLYTTLETSEGTINIPNSGLLSAAVGPVPEPEDDEPAAEPVGEAALDERR